MFYLLNIIHRFSLVFIFIRLHILCTVLCTALCKVALQNLGIINTECPVLICCAVYSLNQLISSNSNEPDQQQLQQLESGGDQCVNGDSGHELLYRLESSLFYKTNSRDS